MRLISTHFKVSMIFTLTAWVTCLSANTVITNQQIESDWLEQAMTRYHHAIPSEISRHSDAAGGCDGIINGQWGFHTQDEKEPFWQIDLGEMDVIGRIVVYNRSGAFASRAGRMQVLFSTDGKNFQQVYQHDNTIFYGHADKKPLTIICPGTPTRFVRLQLPIKSYFHLDEVEIYQPDSNKNIALNKPATQSSVSQWSTSKQPFSSWPSILQATIQRGLALAEKLHIDAGSEIEILKKTELQIKGMELSDVKQWQEIYLKARWAIRKITLTNPLLDFDTIAFVKRAPGQLPHLSDQYYGWWSRPGGGVWLLKDYKTKAPKLKCLTESFQPGNFLRPDLHFDADRLLVAYAQYDPAVSEIKDKLIKPDLPESSFYQIYELKLDGSAPRKITYGRYDDFDARYLPNDDILFISTRKGTFLQTTVTNTMKTLNADLPDSYVRCGGGNFRPVPVFTLHAMSPNGNRIWPISAFETFEYTPSVTHDGRIIYCRWDYIDRFNGPFFSLWSTLPDGTNAQLVYGNYTKRPQATMEPRSIPNSNKLIFTAAAHHSITGGSLVLLDTSVGQEAAKPITRLTPEVPFPETEKNVDMYYANPWPLSEDFYLVSFSNKKLPAHTRFKTDDPRNPMNSQGIYLLDKFGNLELLYRDPAISSMTPIPVRKQPRPAMPSSHIEPDGPQVGAVLVQNVQEGLGNVQPGTVKRLRIIGVIPKPQPHMNSPVLGVSSEETGKFIMGTVPVNQDGSCYFQIPSGMSVFFQALDSRGRAIQTMRSLTYVQPGQTLSCIGCHESRQKAPRLNQRPTVASKKPLAIRPGPQGSWPLRFDKLIQPVLDQKCVSCHSPNKEAKSYDLTAARAWENLLNYADKDLHNLVFEKDASIALTGPSLNSKLLKYLETNKEHKKIKLTQNDFERFYTWMDTYGHIQGSFSQKQDQELTLFRNAYRHLLTTRND